jgi:hypothetical protein
LHPFFLFALLHCPVHMAAYEKSHSLLLAILSQDLVKISHPLVLMHEYPGIRNTSEFSVIVAFLGVRKFRRKDEQ